MAGSELKKKTKDFIDQLSDEDLEIVLPVARRLAELEATREIEQNEALMKKISDGLEDAKQGRTKNWRKVKQENQ